MFSFKSLVTKNRLAKKKDAIQMQLIDYKKNQIFKALKKLFYFFEKNLNEKKLNLAK